MSFIEIPTLDLSQARRPESKPAFLAALRQALLEVGFLYISSTGIDPGLETEVVEQGRAFFDLPEKKKMEIEMKNVNSFLGYSRLANEITAHKIDWREQLDLSTPLPLPAPDAPRYHALLAPNQWPDPAFLPRFRAAFEQYMAAMSSLAAEFTSLLAEAIGLPPNAFDRFFDKDQQHKLKVVKYPDAGVLAHADDSNSSGNSNPDSSANGTTDIQGVGPHKDSMFITFLLQASPHPGLQAQNPAGAWIDCPPRPHTLVVVTGQGLQAVTAGVTRSTTHRVLSPRAGAGPRFSIPFFQGVSYDASFDHMDVPPEVRALRDDVVRRTGEAAFKDDVEFTFQKGRWAHLGEATLMNRVKSHPDVGERWYPDLLAKIREQQRRDGIVVEALGGRGSTY